MRKVCEPENLMSDAQRTPARLHDKLVFRPDDVDLSRSPLRASLQAPTFVLGAFNPGLTRLPNGNLLIMVRIAEALRDSVVDGRSHTIRWTPEKYVLDGYNSEGVNAKDPRQFWITAHHYKTLALTSLSWLLPVELSPDGLEVRAVHYDRAIAPQASYQEYGVEDARITHIDGRWYMTTCSVSAERHCTTLHVSDNGLDYTLEGVILDHQNKDMLLFAGRIGGFFVAQTRPLGEIYFAYPDDSPYLPGPSIQLARSPDALHWKPFDQPGIRPRKGSTSTMKIGGGAPPILTEKGWLCLYHGVEVRGVVGVYRTFWALLDRDDPSCIIRLADEAPLLEARPELTDSIAHQMYVSDIVFTTGIADHGDVYILASGEADLACRITHVPKAAFA
jgi:beta-1,2-mannobiose phosphorylase / 1,2-beta-oligomannan phosphorylase